MKTKTVRYNNLLVDTLVMAGQRGFTVCYYNGEVLLCKGKRVILSSTKNSHDAKAMLDFVNLKYHPSDKHKTIKLKFENLLDSVT